MILELVPWHSKVLKTPTEKFDFSNPQMDPVELVRNLALTMIYHKGIGLAAPQCGIPLSVFVLGDPNEPETVMGVFNPNIVDMSVQQVEGPEGCLSDRGLYLTISRPAEVRLRFADVNGETTTMKFGGLSARIVQHEYDHLQGICFTEKVNKFTLERARRKQKQFFRKNK